MKHWKQGIFGILGIIALTFAFIACDDDNSDTHTHEWEWVETRQATPTTDGLETETCKTCGAESGNTRIIAMAFLRSDEVTFEFGGKATITGTLLKAEWDNIITQLPQIINERYSVAIVGGTVQERYDNVFARTVTITVEKTTDYENWKTGADGKTLWLNFNALSNWSSIINAAVRAMDEFTALIDGNAP